MDPASIATSRRRRRVKTDGIDGEALVRALLAYKRGEPRVCAMAKAPTPEPEDRRQRLERLRTGDGRALPIYPKQRLGRELDRLELGLQVYEMRAICRDNRNSPGTPVCDSESAQ